MTTTTQITAGSSHSTAAIPAFVLEPPRHGGRQPIVLRAGKYIIGRAEDCQIQVDAEGVLPHHVLLIVGERKTLLKAFDERTWINDWPVKESVVRPGDRISLGPVTFRWRNARPEDLLDEILAPTVKSQPAVVPPVVHTSPRAERTDSVLEHPNTPVSTKQNVSIFDDVLPLTVDLADSPTDLALPVVGFPAASEVRVQVTEHRTGDDESRERESAEALSVIARRTEELARRDQELAARESRFTAWERGLKELESRLADQDGELRRLTEQLQEQTQSLHAETASAQEELRCREAELARARESNEQALNTQQREFANLSQRLAEREAAVAESHRQLEQSTSQLAQTQADHASKVEGWQRDIALLAAERERLDELQQTLDSQIAQIAAREQHLNEQVEALARQSLDASSLRAQWDAERAEHQAELERTEDEHRERAAELEQTWAALRQQQQLNDEAQRSLDSARSLLASDQDAFAEQKRQCSRLESELQLAHRQLANDQRAFAEERSRWTTKAAEADRELDEARGKLLAEEQRLAGLAAELEAERARQNETHQRLQQREANLREAEVTLSEQQRQATEETEAQRHAATALQAELAEERERLSQIEAAVETQQEQLAQRQAEVEAREEQLAAERAELIAERQRAALAAEQDHASAIALQAELAAERERLSQIDVAVETQQEQLAKRQAAIEALEEQLAAEQMEFTAERQRAALAAEQEHASATELQAELAAERDRLTELTASLESERQQFLQMQSELEVRQTDLATVQQRIDAAEARQHTLAESLQAESEENQSRLEELAASLESERQLVQEQRADLQLHVEQFERQQLELKQQRDELQQRAAELQSRETAFAEAQAQVKQLTDRFEQERLALQDSQAAREAELQERRQTLDDRLAEFVAEQDRLTARETSLIALEADLERRELELRATSVTELSEPTALAKPDVNSELRAEVERIQDELSREREFRGTLETQLAGLRQRHEHDGAQWQTERMEWVLQRERLEKEVVSLSETLLQQASQPVSEALPQSPAVPVIELEETDDVPYAAADDGEFASESADHSSEAPDAVSSLRAELAKMFDLGEETFAVSEVPESIDDAMDDDSKTRLTEMELREPVESPAPAADDDWRNKLQSMLAESEPEPPVQATSIASVPEQSEEPSSEEEDSISAYMERLLARNRRGSEGPVDEPAPSKRRTAHPEPSASTASPVSAPVAEGVAIDAASVANPVPAPRKPKPRVETDKNAVREHMQAFRQVANVSARSAVAKHTSKTLRTAMIVKGVVASVCLLAGAAFGYGWIVQQQAYLPQAIGCLLMAVVVGADLVRNLLHLNRATSRADASRLPESLGNPPPAGTTTEPPVTEEKSSDVAAGN